MFSDRNDHQQGKGSIKGRKWPDLPCKHGNIYGAKGDTRNDIRDICKLVDQLCKPGTPSLNDGIPEQDTQQGSEKGRIKGKFDGIPGSLVDPRVKSELPARRRYISGSSALSSSAG